MGGDRERERMSGNRERVWMDEKINTSRVAGSLFVRGCMVQMSIISIQSVCVTVWLRWCQSTAQRRPPRP